MPCDSKIALVAPSHPAMDFQLRRYHRSYRRRLRKFARSSERSRDLIYTFPAAAFTIAGAHGNPLRRSEAVKLVQDGAPLRNVGNALNIPNWMRRLPAEAFVEAIGQAPDDGEFARRIVNLIPKEPTETTMWLKWVLRGNALCDQTFALWIAGQRISWAHHSDALSPLPLAAFAWYSRNEGVKARGFIERVWTPKLSLSKAIGATRSWFTRCLEYTSIGGSQSKGRWFVPQRCSGLRFIPLRTQVDLQDEGHRMRHCVGDYVDQVILCNCLIYSVRRGNERIATLEIRPDFQSKGKPVVGQLRGPENVDVDEGVSNAVSRWLARQGKYPFSVSKQSGQLPYDEERWAGLWAPYRSANPERNLDLEPIQIDRALQELSQYQ